MNIPVLFIPFARPVYARQTFEAIKKAKPVKLYIYIDKARKDHPDEIIGNNEVAGLINDVDWECDLKTFVREENVGVYKSILTAIDWVFENEEQAIVFEEDCKPSVAFFDFCEQLLNLYKDNQQVWVISGNNFIEGFNPNNYDYFFSPFAYQWGWATWRDRWLRVKRDGFNVNKIIEYDLYRQLYGMRSAAAQAYKWLGKQQDKDGYYRPVSWDFMFQMSMRINGGFGIVPKMNLVANIGVVGTHSSKTNKITHNRPLPDLDKYLIIKHPPFVVSDFKFTRKFYLEVEREKDTFYIKKIYRFLKRRMTSLFKKNHD
ncbi:hypothetical protein TBC1_11483 [Lentimicrobium saccharophilum]|uniref:Uncharacterized protein n=1 Tax=Lentimicrobium saccharophilum TaxID=1678841 RepID=A0A0S7BW23_9BACT|nr:hypothetical protein [Lentimicrobium saccharophilum]GAP42354.1 hypothetical protein TBC1_11483 [Lentimicrobium saccharophilum]